MALKNYQTSLELDKLYEVTVRGSVKGAEQLAPNLYVNDGNINVYSSNSATEPSAISDMTLNAENTGIAGISKFEVIPRYIALVQNAGTTTEIVATGLDVEDLGSIS